MAEQPKYQAIIDWVEQQIASGNLKYGDRMMSEKELSEKFGLSRQTVRRATGELVSRHLVTRMQGSGTYIGGTVHPARGTRYMNIAVVSTFYESYIFPPTLRGIETVLGKAGFSMPVSFTDNRVYKERRILQNLLEKDNIDGLIFEPSRGALPNPNLDLYREFLSRHIPLISFNASYPELPVPCVRIDDRAITKKATDLLFEAGHTEIGGVFKLDDSQGRLRYAGCMDAMMEHGAHHDPSRIVWYDTMDMQEMDRLADNAFHRLKNCTGVVCYNDEIAMELISQAARFGIRVPEDMSFVGIDDSNLAQICKVPFTSFPHPKEELGRKVAENLLAMIDNPEFDGNYLFDAQPVLRESVKQRNG
jgi:GntR family transcriptional regulator of arabinose operon